MAFSLSSIAFKDEDTIPAKYTCEGKNVSPPLNWGEPPSGTKSLVLIVDDPDAPSGVFTHWVIYNLPPNVRNLEEEVPKGDKTPNGGSQGKTSYGTTGYGGPCPPPGPVHHYRFMLYALDTRLELAPGATKKQVLDAAKGHILAQTEIIGLYRR